jgi:hypothetical protein
LGRRLSQRRLFREGDLADEEYKTRILAAQCAAQVLQGLGNEDGLGSKLAALVTFFEIYMDEGIGKTEKKMKLLDRPGNADLRIVAGGKL